MAPDRSIAAATLDTIKREIGADSPLFRERLKPWPVDAGGGDHAEIIGYSDIFKAACDSAVPHESDYIFALEYIFEGYLLHYATSRLLEASGDDFHLLAGDYMYARGLNHTAAIGDLFCIRILAELVELCSYLHCEDPDRRLVLKAWSVVSLCLADRALGEERCDRDCGPAFEQFTGGAWGSPVAADGLDGLLERQLAARNTRRRREIAQMLEKIYAGDIRDPEA